MKAKEIDDLYGFKEDFGRFGRIEVRGDIKLLSGVTWARLLSLPRFTKCRHSPHKIN